jgi:hypothetical protein
MKSGDPILDKLKALLRLAKSDNVNEATLAMQRAHEIAAKYQVDLSSLPEEDDLRALLGRYMELPSRLALEWKESLNIIHGYFNVHVTTIRRGSRCLIVGTALDVELAEYVCTYLVRACRQCLAAWKETERRMKRKTSGSKLAAFIAGWFIGLRMKLFRQQQEQKAANAGLALALTNGHESRKAYSQQMLGGKSTTITMPEIRRHLRAGSAGFMAGKDTDLNPGLKGPKTQLALC